MAMISSVVPNSGSEIVIKILRLIAEPDELPDGRFLLSNSGERPFPVKKMSLYSTWPNNEQDMVGDRNVWMKDLANGLLIAFINKDVADDIRNKLDGGWPLESVVNRHPHKTYSLLELEIAAHEVRKYLREGIVPNA